MLEIKADGPDYQKAREMRDKKMFDSRDCQFGEFGTDICRMDFIFKEARITQKCRHLLWPGVCPDYKPSMTLWERFKEWIIEI